MKKNFLIFSFFFFISPNSLSQEEGNIEVDLLFLKIQELEIEIADLRNKLESQDYLIQKLIQESVQEDNSASFDSDNFDDLNATNTIRFAGVDDAKSKEEVYKSAINALAEQDFIKASSSSTVANPILHNNKPRTTIPKIFFINILQEPFFHFQLS